MGAEGKMPFHCSMGRPPRVLPLQEIERRPERFGSLLSSFEVRAEVNRDLNNVYNRGQRVVCEPPARSADLVFGPNPYTMQGYLHDRAPSGVLTHYASERPGVREVVHLSQNYSSGPYQCLPGAR